MSTTIQTCPLAFLNRCLKHLAFLFQEKPPVTPDEFVLEHLLICHGLVESAPVNPQSFCDVRADILAAAQRRDSLSLAIALKIPPLSWDEKLKAICTEMAATDILALIETLLPVRQTSHSRSELLGNDDWTIRANAANLLGHLKVQQSVPQLIQALENSSSGNPRQAFPYISLSLARIGSDAAKAALIPYLFSKEAWFAVDAARCLTLWPLSAVAIELFEAMLLPQYLSDYMAVSIAGRYSIVELLKHPNPTVVEGALEVVIGVMKAADATYDPAIVQETKVYLAWPFVKQGLSTSPTPRHIKAALELTQWLQVHLPDFDPQLQPTSTQLTGDCLGHVVLSWLQKYKPSTQDGQVRHAIELAGHLKVTAAVPKLISLLQPRSAFLNEAIESLGKLGDPSTGQALVALVQQIVNLPDRSARPNSAYAVTEENPESALTYWLILKALGQMPDSMSMQFLLAATHDFAADKRLQALSSTIKLCSSITPDKQTWLEVRQAVSRGLHDPCHQVRQTAAEGVQSLSLVEFLPHILAMAGSREVFLRNKAFQVLQSLADSGHATAVLKATRQQLLWEINWNKRRRLVRFLGTNQFESQK